MQEKNVNAKCPHCGADIYLGYNQGSGICPTCRKEFDNKKAIALYNALNNTQQKEEKKKASYGEEYLEVERILKRVDFYINRKEFRKAREEAESGLTISNTDYRLYFEIVRAETKNLTDYRNQSHKQFLDKAIEVADSEERKIIMRLYKNFYQLSLLTDEEIEQYKKEENVAVKKKLEEKLHNGNEHTIEHHAQCCPDGLRQHRTCQSTHQGAAGPANDRKQAQTQHKGNG